MDNGTEFTGRLQDECLNANWFLHLAEAQATLDLWRRDYNRNRPYPSLGSLVPLEYVAKLLAKAGS